MPAPGPSALGRGVVVLPGVAAPQPWAHCRRVVVDQPALENPAEVLATLQRAWFERQPLVVELAIDPKTLQDARPACGRSTTSIPASSSPGSASTSGLGQHLRRPQRGADLVARTQGGPAPSATRASRRSGRHSAGGREPPLCRRGAVRPVAARRRRRRGAPLEHRGRIAHRGRPRPARRRPGSRSAGRGQPRDGGCPGDRPGGVGQDQGADRTAPPPRRRPRGGPRHGDRAGLQPASGRRAPGAMRQPVDGASSPHPDPQQRGPVDLRHVRGSGPVARPRGAVRARPGPAGLRGPSPGQHRHGRSPTSMRCRRSAWA